MNRFYQLASTTVSWILLSGLMNPCHAQDPPPQDYPYALFVLPGLGGTSDRATAINEHGDLVGSSFIAGDITYHATLWQNGEIHDLGTLHGGASEAWDINDLAEVVGWTAPPGGSGTLAFLWRDSEMTDLGTLGGDEAWAWSINNRSQIVGNSFAYGFFWEDGKMTQLASFPNHSARAQSINELGQIAGYAGVPEGGWRAVLWDAGDLRVLGTLDGGDQSFAQEVNDLGVVIGNSEYNAFNRMKAYAWYDGTMYKIHTIREWAFSDAWGINNRNEIVGNVGSEQLRSWGFYFNVDTGMHYLDDLIPPNSQMEVKIAFDVNDHGQIAASGKLREPGNIRRALLLSPVSPEMTLSDPVPGVADQVNTWTITGAQPGAQIRLLFGRRGGGEYVPGCAVLDAALQIQEPKVATTVVADANGEATIQLFVPPAVADFKVIMFQAVDVKHCEESQLTTFDFE